MGGFGMVEMELVVMIFFLMNGVGRWRFEGMGF